MKRNSDTRNSLDQRRTGRARRFYFSVALAVGLCAALTVPALAADSDPLTIVNNLSEFIFSCIKAIGVIVLGWGIVQLGMSVQSHDASQRTQGILCIFGGLIIAFAKEILAAIGVM
ncbi:glutamyl-tRNA amidotransferase [Oscillibacter sp.]|uniref:glutamyl-tRNA amidotransferase n=1 Tax=Oscillibacter sp. TaxID=1945593 RepID=UPI002588659A|nr:glutamyl-tRNA amidotransferase [Oscillibacter sp.]